jgi:hypothetical protein
MQRLFTPGPYRAIGSAIYGDIPQEIDPLRFRGFKEMEPGRGFLIAESIPHSATRNLLAASPVLYDACERAEWWLSTHIEGQTMRDVMRAAILSAHGVQP